MRLLLILVVAILFMLGACVIFCALNARNYDDTYQDEDQHNCRNPPGEEKKGQG